MTIRPSESDLNDLIEGALPPERIEPLRAALAADPDLLRSLRAMIEDRKNLAALGRAAEAAASADRSASDRAAALAVQTAEQEALFAKPAGRHARRAMTAAIAAIVMLAAMVGVALLLVWNLTTHREERLAAAAERSDQRNKVSSFGLSEEVAEALARAAEAPKSEDAPIMPAWASPSASEESLRIAELLAGDAAAAAGDLPPDLPATLAGLASLPAAQSALERLRTRGGGELSLEEAAALSLTQRIRLVVPAGLHAALDSNGSTSLMARGSRADAAGEPPESPAGGSRLAEISVPLEGGLAAISDALARLRARYTGLDGRAPVFVLADDGPSQEAARPVPSLRIDDILWWSRPAGSWTPGVSIEVEVFTSESEHEEP